MIRNYIKVAWRGMWKNKLFTITNLSGLAIGMTATLFILLWVRDEMSWDQFQQDHENIYHVKVNRDFNGEITTDIATPFPLSNGIKEEVPGVAYSTFDDYGGDHVVKYNETIVKKRGYTVGGDYFHVFQWRFLKGDPQAAIRQPENIVITASMAKALFGDADPLGKTVKLDNQRYHTVAAVVQDPPVNSTIQFSFIIPFNPSDDGYKHGMTDWVNSYTQTFVRLQPGADAKEVGRKITALANGRAEPNFDFFLHGMDKWRLYADFRNGINTGGMIDYVRLFIIIAIVILLIACVNFMNLSTAKSEKRSKEVGIRKTMGSARRQLIFQFYSESFLFSMLSFLIAIALVLLLMPLFNQLIDKQLTIPFSDPVFLSFSISLILLTTLIAGSYPALYLSSFNPIRVLKGGFVQGQAGALPRKVLVVLQFGISVLLISSTLLVYQQIQHVKNRQIGYNPSNLISIPSSADANRSAELIKNELAATGYVASVTRTSSPVTQIWNFTPAPDYAGREPNKDIIMAAMRTDVGFASTTGNKILEGRDLTDMPADSNAMLLNKAAVQIMNLKEPIGMQMRYGPGTYNVVGVTENMVMGSPYASVMPMMVLMDRRGGAFYQIRLKDGVQPRTALASIGTIFKKYNPEYPFEYTFTDQEFNKKFVTEDLISNLAKIFAGLAIFLCCLGLSGLTGFTIERRFKEIGIRKVLGASVQQLLLLISREFLLLVLIAAIISIPATWWILNTWLRNYEYRVNISIWAFVASCGGVLLLTLLIVCFNSLKAALANPVNNLRSE